MEIEIEILKKGTVKVLLDDRNPSTAQEFHENLPMEGEAQLWQEEVFFPIPFEHDYENPSPSADKGDVSYWPPGKAFCIFFGDSQPASDVNHIGRVVEGLEIMKRAEEGDWVVIRK
ncbi:cyclophilin-like fold protein [uncultured Methanobacterium sp.]|uniref:cyclophilin-like fold protein n=1 Tax=uncultured Methanobacterium sp. TaxID=176306 RepID=UPI002AA78AD8|nr:cyclophilin-like fold protein [uncultured Methanobacterium sp.]